MYVKNDAIIKNRCKKEDDFYEELEPPYRHTFMHKKHVQVVERNAGQGAA